MNLLSVITIVEFGYNEEAKLSISGPPDNKT